MRQITLLCKGIAEGEACTRFEQWQLVISRDTNRFHEVRLRLRNGQSALKTAGAEQQVGKRVRGRVRVHIAVRQAALHPGAAFLEVLRRQERLGYAQR